MNHSLWHVRLIAGALCILAIVSFDLWLMPIAFAGEEGHVSSCVYLAGEENSFYENEKGETVETLLKIVTLKKAEEYRERFQATDESGNQIAPQ